MKTCINSATFLLLMMAGSLATYGQDTGGDSGTSLFGKGTWLINLYRPISFSAYTDKYANSNNKNSDFRLNLEDYYFFHKNMGVGLNLDLSRSVSDRSYKQINTTTVIFASYLQGFNIGKLDFLAKIGVGIGKTKDVTKLTGSTDLISNLVRFKIEAGPVFKLSDNQSVLFEPTIGFKYDMTSFRDYKEKSPEFIVRANFLFNLGFDDFNCDSKTGFADSHLRFVKGMNTISASTMFDAQFGGLTQKFGSYSNDYVINSQALMFNVRHFVINGLSVGAFASFRHDYQKSTASSESSSNSKNTDLLIGPGATWYPLTGMKYLENIFLDLNVGLGKNINNNYGNKISAGVFGGYVDAGFDYGISKNLSAVPELGLRFYRYNYPGSTADYSELGPFFSLGLRASF